MASPEDDDFDFDKRFREIWIYCMVLHPGIGTLPGGPCMDCVAAYAVDGPPPLPLPEHGP